MLSTLFQLQLFLKVENKRFSIILMFVFLFKFKLLYTCTHVHMYIIFFCVNTPVYMGHTIQRESLSVTCDRSVVFSRYSTNKTDHHDITEIFLKVALSTTIPFPFKQIQYEK